MSSQPPTTYCIIGGQRLPSQTLSHTVSQEAMECQIKPYHILYHCRLWNAMSNPITYCIIVGYEMPSQTLSHPVSL